MWIGNKLTTLILARLVTVYDIYMMVQKPIQDYRAAHLKECNEEMGTTRKSNLEAR